MAGRRLALIVATDEYEDPGLHKLRAPAEDAEALAEVLGDPELGDFEVSTLHNETHWTIGQRVEALLADAKLDDLIVLHFSCHGIKDDTGELYLAATNTKPNLLATTAVEAALVNRLVRRSRSQRILLLLDCCFGGAFERGMAARAAGDVDVSDQFRQRDQDLGGGRGRVVITASSAMEFAFEGSDLADSSGPRPSIFTGSLVDGLRTGAADRDNDGMFSLGEVYDYVFDRVRQASPNQTPSKFEFGVQGEFILARNPQRVVLPGPVPARFRRLAGDPYPATRVGSIADLKRLGEGTDLPLAAGARQQIERMVEDDSRQVAAAAAAAMAELTLRVSVPSIDFGEVAAGSEPPMAEVSIEGPPLAAASRVSASVAALHVRKVDRLIRIEVDTAAPGGIEGVVRVEGAAGTVEIPVTANVLAVVDASPTVVEVASASPVADPELVMKQVVAAAPQPEPEPRRTAAPPVARPIFETGDEAPLPSSVASPARPAGREDPIQSSPSVPLTRDLDNAAYAGPGDGTLERSRRTMRQLIQKGWQTGHAQTLIGAEIGAFAIMPLDLQDRLHQVFREVSQEVIYELAYAAIWFGAVVGAFLFLRLAGPSSWWKTVVALAILYPLFRGMTNGTAIYAGNNLANTLISLTVVGALALLASSVVRLRRPGPA